MAHRLGDDSARSRDLLPLKEASVFPFRQARLQRMTQSPAKLFLVLKSEGLSLALLSLFSAHCLFCGKRVM